LLNQDIIEWCVRHQYKSKFKSPKTKSMHRTSLHSKKCWVVLTQFWVKYGQTKCLSLSIFDPKLGKTSQHFLECTVFSLVSCLYFKLLY